MYNNFVVVFLYSPKLSNRLATMDANRRSPARSEMRNTYSGAFTWLLRCVRPNCWMARSADQGSSSVMWTRRRWFRTRRSLCREMPLEAASEMMATSFSPSMKRCFSVRFSVSSGTSISDRLSYWMPSSVCTTLPETSVKLVKALDGIYRKLLATTHQFIRN